MWIVEKIYHCNIPVRKDRYVLRRRGRPSLTKQGSQNWGKYMHFKYGYGKLKQVMHLSFQ